MNNTNKGNVQQYNAQPQTDGDSLLAHDQGDGNAKDSGHLHQQWLHPGQRAMRFSSIITCGLPVLWQYYGRHMAPKDVEVL